MYVVVGFLYIAKNCGYYIICSLILIQEHTNIIYNV